MTRGVSRMVVAAIGGALFLAWKPGVARSMLGTPRAAGFTLLVGVLVLGAGWLVPRLGPGRAGHGDRPGGAGGARLRRDGAAAFGNVTVDEAA